MQGRPTWVSAPERSWPDERGLRLTIVIPFRDREDNLAELLPALHEYFLAGARPRRLPPPRVCVVEQDDRALFNKGMLCNIGFDIHQHELDAVCFHDVDCIPVDVDYSHPDRPARLIEVGTRNKEDLEVFFGAVVATSREDFRRVNGFSNGYLRWGFEDHDLLLRFVRNGYTLEARRGVFRALVHRPHERDDRGQVQPEVIANRDRFRRRFDAPGPFWIGDGLDDLRYRVVDTRLLSPASGATLEVLHHRVQFGPPAQAEPAARDPIPGA